MGTTWERGFPVRRYVYASRRRYMENRVPMRYPVPVTPYPGALTFRASGGGETEAASSVLLRIAAYMRSYLGCSEPRLNVCKSATTEQQIKRSHDSWLEERVSRCVLPMYCQ